MFNLLGEKTQICVIILTLSWHYQQVPPATRSNIPRVFRLSFISNVADDIITIIFVSLVLHSASLHDMKYHGINVSKLIHCYNFLKYNHTILFFFRVGHQYPMIIGCVFNFFATLGTSQPLLCWEKWYDIFLTIKIYSITKLTELSLEIGHFSIIFNVK